MDTPHVSSIKAHQTDYSSFSMSSLQQYACGTV